MLIVSESDEEEDYILVTEPIVDCCLLDGSGPVAGAGASSNSGNNNSATIGAGAGTKLSLSRTEETCR